MKCIVIAPHADDEVIGTWDLVRDKNIDLRVLYDEPPSPSERIMFHRMFPWVDVIAFNVEDINEKVDVVKRLAVGSDVTCFFPDPVYELHPMHKMWGSVGLSLYVTKQIKTVAFYSTNMNAPYMRLVDSPQVKRAALDNIYPSKMDLWRYDHKYWLFNGMCSWI